MSHEAGKAPSPYRFSGIDLVLLLLGMAGVFAYALLLPTQHPDSASEYELTEAEAITRSSAFLASQGFSIDGLDSSARMKRRPELLVDLQRTLGRSTAVDFLDTDNRNQISVYFWEVNYVPTADDVERGILSESDPIFTLELAQDGKVLALENRTSSFGALSQRLGSAFDRINRAALSSVIRADTATNAEARTAIQAISDSLLGQGLSFDLSSRDSVSGELLLNTLIDNQPITLDSAKVAGLLSYHLAQTAFADVDWAIDSMYVSSANRNEAARVTLRSDPPIAGQHFILDASIPTSGTLSQFSVDYNPDRAGDSAVSNTLEIIKIGLLALLSFTFIVVFFRRMFARLLDIKSALLDAMILGLLAGFYFATSSSDVAATANAAPLWGNFLIRLLVFSIIAGAVSIFTFMVAGVTDSVVRESYEGKLGTLILLRHGDFQNRPMGASMVRGLAIGGILLGVSVIALWQLPTLNLSLSDTLVIDTSFRPVVTRAFASFETSYFFSLLWIVGVGTVAYRISSHPVLSIILLTVTGAFLKIGPIPFEAGYVALGVSAVTALILALAFIRFDIVTVIVAFFSASLLFDLSEGFLVTGTATWIDLLLGSLFLGSLLILGFTGVASKRTGQQVNTYVPEYVTEMAGQERVKRELEIAQQVQSFFLPRTMPDIPGLDIAGMCLSANEVGGDYYDFIPLDNDRLAFVLGDVSGKGIQAAFFMTLVKGIVQTLSRQGLRPAEIMKKLNHLFCQNAPAGTFISVVYGEIDPRNRTFTFSRAGHNPVIHYSSSSHSADSLQPRGMAIGFSDGPKFDDNIEEMTIEVGNGDALVFYTDGFSEAMNRARELYGDDRLVVKVGQIGGRTSSAILRMMTEDVHHFIEGMGRADDMTMAVIKLS